MNGDPRTVMETAGQMDAGTWSNPHILQQRKQPQDDNGHLSLEDTSGTIQ